MAGGALNRATWPICHFPRSLAPCAHSPRSTWSVVPASRKPARSMAPASGPPTRCFHGPLHYLHRRTNRGMRPRRVATDEPAARPRRGTGAAGAGLGGNAGARGQSVLGVDTLPWALAQAAFTYRTLGLEGDTRRGHAARFPIPRTTDARIVAGWLVNVAPPWHHAMPVCRSHIEIGGRRRPIESHRGADRHARVTLVERSGRGVSAARRPSGRMGASRCRCPT